MKVKYIHRQEDYPANKAESGLGTVEMKEPTFYVGQPIKFGKHEYRVTNYATTSVNEMTVYVTGKPTFS